MRLLLGAPQVQHILRHVRKRRIKIDLSPGGFETTTGSQLVRFSGVKSGPEQGKKITLVTFFTPADLGNLV
jgi:hypothetical protein